MTGLGPWFQLSGREVDLVLKKSSPFRAGKTLTERAVSAQPAPSMPGEPRPDGFGAANPWAGAAASSNEAANVPLARGGGMRYDRASMGVRRLWGSATRRA
jgi:hypothetical protein